MSLEDLYIKENVPNKDRVNNSKNIVLIGPDSEYDFVEDLKLLNIDKREVVYTYPKIKEKPEDFLMKEVKAIKPQLIIQVGGYVVSPKLPSIVNGKISDKLKELISTAIGPKFINLHHHDEYSIRDGLGTNKQLIEKLKKNKLNFCSVTNHGSLAGWIQQHANCKKADIKALFGCEMYFSQSGYRGDDPVEKKKNRSANHLLTIAKTEEGFYNIIKMHNDAQLNGMYYSPRVNKEALQKWGKGVISSTTCYSGLLPQLLREGKKDEAKDWLKFYQSCFSDFYIELPMIEWGEQVKMNKELIQFGKEMKVPFIATLDSHYLEKEHAETHDILMLIRDKKTILDKIENKDEVWQFETRNLYYKTEQELRQLWEDGFEQKFEEEQDGIIKTGIKRIAYKDDIFTKDILNEAIENTRNIALMCNEMKLDSTLKLPKMHANGEEILRNKAWQKFKEKGLDKKGIVYKERLDFELNMICELGYADYFLTLETIIQETIKEFGEFAVAWGRGSGAGSLVCYCIEITYIDPIEYGLLFERFLDFSRRPVSVCSFKV